MVAVDIVATAEAFNHHNLAVDIVATAEAFNHHNLLVDMVAATEESSTSQYRMAVVIFNKLHFKMKNCLLTFDPY